MKFSGLINYNSRWHVPISVVSGNNSTPVKVMMDREEDSCTVKLPGVSSSEWIKINPGVVGYYRVNYDPEEAKSLETSTRYELRTVFTLSAV